MITLIDEINMTTREIDKLKENISVEELTQILENAGRRTYEKIEIKDDPKAIYKNIGKKLDDFLISKKAEKCVIFSDFDPLSEICNLSQKTKVYWFCFEQRFSDNDLRNYKGFVYKVQDIYDIADGLVKVNSKRFETLCYSDNQKKYRR